MTEAKKPVRYRSIKALILSLLLWMAVSTPAYAQDTLWIFTFPSDSNVSVTVHCIVSPISGGYSYNYSLISSASSEQSVEGFFIDHGSSILSIGSPAQWLGDRSGLPSEISYSIMWGSRDSLADIFPGGQLEGFNITSPGIPSIYRFYAKGYSPTPILEGEPDSLVGADVFENSFKGRSIAPKDPLAPFNSLAFLDTLLSYTTQSRSLGWIKDQPTADKYLQYFSSARAKLVQGDSVGARTPLQQVLRDVDIDSTANLTSEAYALLRYNTEYLLSQLPAGQEGVAPYSLFATHSMWLRENSKVYSGNVGVDSAGSPPFLDSQVELSIGQGVTIASGSTVKAHRMKVKQGAMVNGDVYYNELDNNGAITGSQQTPLSLPLVASLPEFEASTPGTQNISVAQNGSQTLAPGSYGDIEVKKNGRLTLTGGTYHLSSITAGEDTRILVQSTSEIRIADKLSSGEGSYIGPEDTTSLSAPEVKFYVGGINGKTGTLGADPKAAKIGMRNTVKAMFYVPNGTLWIREGSEVEGAFIGKDLEVGIGVKVWWKSGF
jgi:hypothetical protein